MYVKDMSIKSHVNFIIFKKIYKCVKIKILRVGVRSRGDGENFYIEKCTGGNPSVRIDFL